MILFSTPGLVFFTLLEKVNGSNDITCELETEMHVLVWEFRKLITVMTVYLGVRLCFFMCARKIS